MKIRDGFVSNSSSSSFMVAYRDASIHEIDNPKVMVRRCYYGDGEAYFRPTSEMINFIEENGLGKYYSLIFEYFTVDEMRTLSKEELMEIVSNLPEGKNIRMEAFEIDQHQPKNLNDFINLGEYK